MEWYAFGLDKIMMFLFAFSCAGGIVLAVMFSKSLVERGPRKYIKMS
jgi:hypothetical protein